LLAPLAVRMKTVRIHVEENRRAEEIIDQFISSCPSQLKQSTDFNLQFSYIKQCVEDFIDKLHKISGAGTTINIEKEFIIEKFIVTVSLSYPIKKSILAKILEFFSGKDNE
jgi:hexokinase